jgi:O-antigen chain-terminating methyltransferase
MDPQSEELAAAIAEIRQRVRARHPNGVVLGDVPLADLMPLARARDAAEGKVASIGTVNPRPPGLLNSAAQSVKRLVARALNWHVREQVEFNRAVLECVQATIDALNECNRTVAGLAPHVSQAADTARQMEDVRSHWSHWRVEWEKKLSHNEIVFLKSIADLQAAFQHRVTQLETNYRDQMRAQHTNFELALEQASAAIQKRLTSDLEGMQDHLSSELDQLQKRFWADFEQLQKRLWADLDRIRLEYESIIHAELRLTRQRASLAPTAAPPAPQSTAEFDGIDWLKFAEKFRGSEPDIEQRQQMYAARFQKHAPVLDIGCGRGEMLSVFRAAGIPARGIDLNEDSVALCHSKGLDAERADLFAYLSALPDSSLGGIVCCQVVEHLPPERLPEMIRLAHAKLRSGALLAIETPNPECLAIFATHFYLDPTHRHPIPPALLSFYLEEAGFGRIEVERLSPAIETMPALAELPETFRKNFFGTLDYAVFARRLFMQVFTSPSLPQVGTMIDTSPGAATVRSRASSRSRRRCRAAPA